MSVKTKHVLAQGPVLRTLAGVAVSAIRRRNNHSTEPPVTPSEEISATVRPLPADLIRDYVRHVGGDPGSYKGVVPPHLFPQWGFPLAARTLTNLPYPMFKVLNGGCRVDVHAPLPAGEPLRARARLEDIDDNGRRAVIHQVVVTGTDAEPYAVVAHLYAVVPLGSSSKGGFPDREGGGPDGALPRRGRAGAALHQDNKNGKSNGAAKKEPVRVPHDAEEIGRWRLRADAGLDFAKLTGDFNPVHWIPPYARAFGFRNTILHGFSTMARAWEGVQRGIFAGSTRAIETFDVQFTKPLVLPAKVGLYVHEGETRRIFVGDAPGGPAYLAGSFVARTMNGASV